MSFCRIFLNRLGAYRSVRTVKSILLILSVGILLFVLVLARPLAFVAELVLLCILQLLVERASLSLRTLALAAFLM